MRIFASPKFVNFRQFFSLIFKVKIYASLFVFISALGYVKLPLKQQKHVIFLSNRDINRISFSNDRIKEVFGLDKRVSIQSDDENGYIFIKAIEDFEEPMLISVVTESGIFQDFEVHFSEKGGENVVIYDPLESLKGEKNSNFDELLVCVKAVFLNEGEKRKASSKLDRKIGNNIILEAKAEVFLRKYTAIIFEVSTKDKNGLFLEERVVIQPNDKGIFLEKNRIEYGEKVKCIVFRLKDAI